MPNNGKMSQRELDAIIDDIDASIVTRVKKSSRPKAPVWWYGGKGLLSARIVAHLPRDHIYVEPYCGAAAVFWRIEPYPIEVLNDLNEEVISFFRVLQNRRSMRELLHRIIWTPYSRSEFLRALNHRGGSAVDRAWAFYIKQNVAISGIPRLAEGNWSRSFMHNDTEPRLRNRLSWFQTWHERLSKVQLDCRDALEVIRYWDSPQTVFYIDPPYDPETRAKGSRNVYSHEASREHLMALRDLLINIRGQAVLSHYPSDIFDPLLKEGWANVDIRTACYAACRSRRSGLQGKGAALKKVPRTERLYLKVTSKHKSLFEVNPRCPQ